jgi:hypothetical protein
MKIALRLLALTLLALAAAVLLGLAAALQDEPAVAEQSPIDHQDVARAVALLRLHDPRHNAFGFASTAVLGERDLDVLLNHGAHRWLGAASHVGLASGRATLRLSLPAAPNPFGRWLNVEVDLVETGALPVIESARLGRLPVPAWLAERAALGLAEQAGLGEELRLAAEVVRRVKFMPQRLLLSYVWRGDTSGRLLEALLSEAEQQRLRAYSDRLVEVAARAVPGWDVSLARLLGPLFELARARTAAGADAASENRAALVVLTLFANGRSVAAVWPGARGWPRARSLRVLLAGRDDSPLHFLVSAALAAEGTSPLSRAIGVYKEVADSRGGSGFSFNDLAADRAGTRFGELAVNDPQRLQARLSRGVGERDFMPEAADLPENMAEPDFVRRYGGVGAPRYGAMLAEIERRVGSLALYQ